MSEVPPPYNRSYSFTDFSTYTPNLQQPGNKIDQELNNVRVSVNATIDRLSEIQRDDGKLDSTSLDFNDIFTGLSTQLSLTYAAINSPALTGSPTAPTPSTSDSSTKIATTAFVKSQDYATISDLASLQSSLSGYLPLGGGLMTGPIDFATDGLNDSELAAWGLGVENTNGHLTTVQATGLRAWDGVNITGTSVTSTGITFNDGSTQASAYNPAVLGNYLPLAGGVLNYGSNYIGINPQNGDSGQIYFDGGSAVTTLDGYQLNFKDGTSSYRADGASIKGGLSMSNAETGNFSFEFGADTGIVVGNSLGNSFNYNGNGMTLIGSDTSLTVGNMAMGYLNNTLGEGILFSNGSTQVTAALPLTGGTMSGAIRFDNVGTQNIAKGSFDSGRGGYNGISLVCAVDYELNWQAGYLKALNSGGFNVPINVESDIVLSKYVETGEDLPPAHTITTTISLDGGISCNANDDFNDHNFNLHTDGVGGVPSSDQSWGLNNSGVGGDDGDNTFGLNSNGVGGFNSYRTWGINISGAGGDSDGDSPWSVGSNGFSANNEADTCALNGSQVTGYNGATDKTWSFGINGLTFADGTTMTTASGGAGSLSAGTITEGDNNATIDAYHLAFYSDVDNNSSLNQNELRLNSNIDYYTSLTNQELHIASDDQHIHVKATTGITFGNGVAINSPSAGNSGLSQSGNIAHSDYPKEIRLVINGVTYAFPARIVT